MSPGKDYLPCQYCGANNITHRQNCWKCGAMLPYTMGLDGRTHTNQSATAVNHLVDEALSQATIIDLEQDKRQTSEAENANEKAQALPRLWRWLYRHNEGRSNA